MSIKLFIIKTVWPRITAVLDAVSQLVNTLPPFNGHANESLSGRAHRTKSKWEKVIDTILFFDKDHCKVSHENDVKYAKWLLSLGDADPIEAKDFLKKGLL